MKCSTPIHYCHELKCPKVDNFEDLSSVILLLIRVHL